MHDPSVCEPSVRKYTGPPTGLKLPPQSLPKMPPPHQIHSVPEPAGGLARNGRPVARDLLGFLDAASNGEII